MEYEEPSLKTIQDSIKRVSEELTKHEYEDARVHKHEYKEATKMGMDNISDKVNINVGEGGGRGDSGATAAIIAALGNRNQGNDNAALIAALGNRNDNQLGPLMAMLGNNRDRDGMGEMWPLLLLLLGRGGRGGGLFGGGDGDCGGGGDAVNQLTLNQVLGKLGTLEGQIPLTAAQAQNAIQASIAQLALADQQGFANVKDAFQNFGLFQTNQLNAINQNVSDQGCQTRELVQAGTTQVLQRMDDLRIRELEARAERAERAIEVNSLRSQVEITNTNTASSNQQQGQFQAQLQFQDINNKIDRLCGSINVIGNQVQNARSMNDTINFGTMAASGNQNTSSTQVR